MRDNQSVMLQFVKIVERHPEIYNTKLDAYRMRSAVERAWERVADSVRSELHEECTIDEIKGKWKGIRSSYCRFKCRLNQSNYDSITCKKYYLYDSLRFLEPFNKLKSAPNDNTTGFVHDTHSFSLDNESSIEYEQSEESYEQLRDIKPEIHCIENDIKFKVVTATKNPLESENDNCEPSQSKRMKSDIKDHDSVNDNEDMQFFRSILPDIKSFSKKEKRKLKMGILKLIDDIDNERSNTN